MTLGITTATSDHIRELARLVTDAIIASVLLHIADSYLLDHRAVMNQVQAAIGLSRLQIMALYDSTAPRDLADNPDYHALRTDVLEALATWNTLLQTLNVTLRDQHREDRRRVHIFLWSILAGVFLILAVLIVLSILVGIIMQRVLT